MVFADEIRKTILRLADEAGMEKSFEPADVARAIDQKNWPLLIDQVKFVADVLIREGKITAAKTTSSSGEMNETLHFKKLL